MITNFDLQTIYKLWHMRIRSRDSTSATSLYSCSKNCTTVHGTRTTRERGALLTALPYTGRELHVREELRTELQYTGRELHVREELRTHYSTRDANYTWERSYSLQYTGREPHEREELLTALRLGVRFIWIIRIWSISYIVNEKAIRWRI